MRVNVAFRVDASTRIGTGHLMRCLTLADALAQRGADARFVCRQLPDDFQRLILERGHSCAVIGTGPGDANETQDACESASALSDRQWHWLVVDHYGLGAAWERVMRATAARLFAIDDLADRIHDCDVLLDQNYLAQGAARYSGKVPEGCQILAGPGHALLRPEYRAWRERRRPRPHAVQRILVFFGGTDPQNMTMLAMEALTDPAFAHLAVDVVTGRDPERRAVLDRLAAERPGTTIHGPRPHLADLMAEADLALGGGGSTTWERMCLGLRSLVISLAENQVCVAQSLAREGLIKFLGKAEEVSVRDVRDALRGELDRPEDPATVEGMALCDGLGVSRVVDAMLRLEAAS